MSDYYFNFVMDNETHIIPQVANRLGVTKDSAHYKDFDDLAYILLLGLAESMDANGGEVVKDWFVSYFRIQSDDEAMSMTKWACEAGLTNGEVGTPKAVDSVITPFVNAIESSLKDDLDSAAALAYEARGPIWTERADND